MNAVSHHPGATALRRVAAGLALGTALAACLASPPAPMCPVAVASASASASVSAPVIASSTAPSARAPLRPMNDDFGKWECGKPWLDMEEPAPRRPRPGGECLADTGCDMVWELVQPPTETCPPRARVVTMEELARDEPGAPAADDTIVVRGRLVSFRNRTWPVLTSHNDCGYGRPLLAIEQPVHEECYALGLDSPMFGCEFDSTKNCCTHLPVGREIAVVGAYSPPPPGVRDFAAWLRFARICTLPAPP